MPINIPLKNFINISLGVVFKRYKYYTLTSKLKQEAHRPHRSLEQQ